MINLEKVKQEKCQPLPPSFRGPAPTPYFHPLFLVFQIPPPGEVIKIYSPPLKKGEKGGRGEGGTMDLRCKPLSFPILCASYKTAECKIQNLKTFAEVLKMQVNKKLEIKEHVKNTNTNLMFKTHQSQKYRKCNSKFLKLPRLYRCKSFLYLL